MTSLVPVPADDSPAAWTGRNRNRPQLEPLMLTDDHLDWVRNLGDCPLDLDPEARRVARQLELDAPPPGRLARVAPSLLIRTEVVGERS
jgi:hypothetical protein